jgi:hypothetical protein
MRVCFSRKGCDAGSCGVASPILPTGELWSLPIPGRSQVRYCDLARGGLSLGDLVVSLSAGRLRPQMRVHLDPDLEAGDRARAPGWKPLFGQTGAAERHLQRQGVGAGDLFLFYGWFRQTRVEGGALRFAAGAGDLHVIFGWLQIERRLDASDLDALPAWAMDHPHSGSLYFEPPNSLYLATDRLCLPGSPPGLPGAGLFRRFLPCLQLTARGMSRSVWALPAWLYPGEGRPGLSYHRDLSRWQREGERVLLNTVGRGQEFVLDSDCYPEGGGWLAGIFSAALPGGVSAER